MAHDVLQQQVDYYRARAGEYDQWFLRQGRYDRGPQQNAQWFGEVDTVVAALDAFGPRGDVLELACGTGLWTQRLAPYASQLTSVDASAEVIAINRDRVAAANVRYVEADLFTWQPPAHSYDVVFFSFWLSHVPPDRFDAFWTHVRKALRPNGRFFLIDSLREQTSTAVDHVLPDESEVVMTRRLNDGREFDIIKIFYAPGSLQTRLESLGWTAEIKGTPRFFVYGSGMWAA